MCYAFKLAAVALLAICPTFAFAQAVPADVGTASVEVAPPPVVPMTNTEKLMLYSEISQVMDGVRYISEIARNPAISTEVLQKMQGGVAQAAEKANVLRATAHSPEVPLDEKRDIVYDMAKTVQQVIAPFPEGFDQKSVEHQTVYMALRNAKLLKERLQLAEIRSTEHPDIAKMDANALSVVKHLLEESNKAARRYKDYLEGGVEGEKRQQAADELLEAVTHAARIPVSEAETSPVHQIVHSIFDESDLVEAEIAEHKYEQEQLEKIDNALTSVIKESGKLNDITRAAVESDKHDGGVDISDKEFNAIMRIADDMDKIKKVSQMKATKTQQ